MASLSLIIPAYNEEKYIGLLLEDLATQSVRPSQVIVVDNRSIDNTVKEVQKFNGKLQIEIVESRIRTAAAARNTGASFAKSDFLLFIDADMRIPNDFIEKIQSTLRELNPDFLTPLFKTEGKYLVDRFTRWVISSEIRIRIGLLHRTFGIGGVMCVRRSMHNKVGGFIDRGLGYEDINYMRALSN